MLKFNLAPQPEPTGEPEQTGPTKVRPVPEPPARPTENGEER